MGNPFVIISATRVIISPMSDGYEGYHGSNMCVGPSVQAYRQTSNIRRTRVGNEIVAHSDVVGAPPVGAAPTTFSFST